MTRRQRRRVRRVIITISAALAIGAFAMVLGVAGSIEREVISGADAAVRFAASGLMCVGFTLVADVFYRAQRADR